MKGEKRIGHAHYNQRERERERECSIKSPTLVYSQKLARPSPSLEMTRNFK
jgi:hypothetical protein